MLQREAAQGHAADALDDDIGAALVLRADEAVGNAQLSDVIVAVEGGLRHGASGVPAGQAAAEVAGHGDGVEDVAILDDAEALTDDGEGVGDVLDDGGVTGVVAGGGELAEFVPEGVAAVDGVAGACVGGVWRMGDVVRVEELAGEEGFDGVDAGEEGAGVHIVSGGGCEWGAGVAGEGGQAPDELGFEGGDGLGGFVVGIRGLKAGRALEGVVTEVLVGGEDAGAKVGEPIGVEQPVQWAGVVFVEEHGRLLPDCGLIAAVGSPGEQGKILRLQNGRRSVVQRKELVDGDGFH